MGFFNLFGKRPARPDPEKLLETIFTFIQADTWNESQRIVKQHPELLSDEAEALLGQLIEAAAAQGDENARRTFEQHRALLHRCRQVGVEQAFAEKTLPPEALEQAAALGLTPEQVAEMARLAADDPEAALRQMAEQMQLLQIIQAFITADTWSEKQRIVEAHPELLSDEAEALLGQLIEFAHSQGEEEIRLVLEDRRALLRRCRQVGVAQTFAEKSALLSIWDELVQLTRPQDMPRRIALCRQALALVRREENAPLWAALQVELAYNLDQNPQGNRAESLEQAIHHYRQALEVYTRQVFPEDWARTQNNLATAYAERIRGERAENLEQAIHHYRQALEVYTRQVFPEDWARTQNNLAAAYAERIRGERAKNLEQAIRHYRQALEVYTRQAFPEDWAMTQNNLAAAYADRIRGGRAENIEQAIHHYQQALEVYTRQAFPKEWAMTQNGLATAYAKRIRGKRAENLEQAIHHYRQALEVFTRQAFPQYWARTQNNLANTYSDRIRGERAKNIEQAIQHYRQALEVYTRQAFPEDWAMTQSNLATAYVNRIRGERAKNLEQAIRHSHQALEVYTRQTFPEGWARTQNNLGLAYVERLRGDRAENLEQAIHHYRQALEVYTRQAFPEDWAITQNNLATAYAERMRGERAENLEQAIQHFRQALEVFTRQVFPEDWARTQNNLANAYAERLRGDRAKNLEQAIRYYRQALEVYTRQAFPEDWAGTHNNLANAYRNRIRGERAENIEQAIHHYQQALVVYTHQAFPEDWARTQNNLANAYSDRIHGERAENIKQAIHHYRQALEVLTRQAFPNKCRTTARVLGNLGFENKNWRLAVEGYTQALAAHETLLRAALLRASKGAELEEIQSIPIRLAYAWVQLEQPEQAVAALEGGRARLLAEALESNRRDLERLPDLGFGEIHQAYTQAAGRYAELLALAEGESRPPDWQAQAEKAQEELHAAVIAIRETVGAQHPEFRYFMQALPFEEIQRQTRDAPLVYLGATQHGGLALIVRGEGQPEVVALPELSEAALRAQVVGPADDPALGGYLGYYFAWRDNLTDPTTRQAWFEALAQTTRWLWDAAMEPVVATLQDLDYEQAVLIPGGLLGLLPLHAAWTEEDGRRRYALDDFTFTYAPSAQALYHARQAAERPADSLLAVRYPDPRFQMADQAIQAALDGFSPERTRPLLMEKAQKPAVLAAFDDYDVLFFFTHGRADFDRPLDSGLQMAGEDTWLTLEEVFALRSERARLAVLAACEVGVPTDLDLLDEVVSLPAGMMQAGVPGVVGTLWPVAESSTAMLISIFFEEWRAHGLKPPQALRRAQQILRDARTDAKARAYFERYLMPTDVAHDFHVEMLIEEFSHPFYWAAFTYTGL